MPAQPYFQSAAAELRKAVLEKRHDIDVLKRELGDLEQATMRRVQELKTERQRKESEAGSSNMDDSERMVKLGEAQKDMSEEVQAQNHFNQERDRINREVSDIERDIIDIENKIRELETRT